MKAIKENDLNKEVLRGIITYFKNYGEVSAHVEKYIQKHFYYRQVKKLDHIVEPGQANDNLFFIIKGVIRGYIKIGDREITTWINDENEIVSSIRNFGTDAVSEEYLQALEVVDLLVLPRESILHLYKEYPETNIIGRLIIEENYRDAEERAFICRIPQAEARYQRFVRKRGTLVNRISLKYIANYLNMNLETLSRIRGRRL